ncbi:MAG: ATP-binding cassette domain-containing protein [Anaerolineae bacterium]|nr:ATP-binding cassette domain-containing protein [Anaerolineae bacterium]NIN99436.1 ATP-binding cassette domain-containing protein [Anaerolineae bacterium]NIQ82301.1 ATP-binding cassette domain-containing protein [Anaerolineae bacterium]
MLDIKDLRTEFDTADGVVRAVNGVSFSVHEGETVGIVGESGCGKTVTALSIVRLIPEPPGRIASGRVLFRGRDLLAAGTEELGEIRGAKIGFIFQDPMTSLNPVLTIGEQIVEALELHLDLGGNETRQRAIELLQLVGIPDAQDRIDDYPHLFSGGMRQRAMIAMALCCNPHLLIADEPTTALDVTIQAQILDLVRRLKRDRGLAILWITHDLGIIAGLADRVLVMYAGYIVEAAEVKALYRDPRHPYTLGLLSSVPRLDDDRREALTPIEGVPPDLVDMPSGCPFHPRCKYADYRCAHTMPEPRKVGADHLVACWVDVPKVSAPEPEREFSVWSRDAAWPAAADLTSRDR